jgi:hypothetical protein
MTEFTAWNVSQIVWAWGKLGCVWISAAAPLASSTASLRVVRDCT